MPLNSALLDLVCRAPAAPPGPLAPPGPPALPAPAPLTFPASAPTAAPPLQIRAAPPLQIHIVSRNRHRAQIERVLEEEGCGDRVQVHCVKLTGQNKEQVICGPSLLRWPAEGESIIRQSTGSTGEDATTDDWAEGVNDAGTSGRIRPSGRPTTNAPLAIFVDDDINELCSPRIAGAAAAGLLHRVVFVPAAVRARERAWATGARG